jgi:hypothetical protein
MNFRDRGFADYSDQFDEVIDAPKVSGSGKAGVKHPPIQWLDISEWDGRPPPQRQYAILDRVPLKQAGLFSGEGGAGKSIIELMKDVAHVAA